MSFNVSFEDSLTIRGNLAAWDGNSLAFLSAFGTITNIKNTEQRLRVETSINVAYNRFKAKGKDFNIYTSKAKGTDFMHIILSRKDEIKNTGYKIYCFFNSPDTEISAGYRYGELSFSASEDVYDLIYNKLNNVSSVPILKEWMPYITRMLYQNYSLDTSLRVHNEDDNISFKTLSIDTSDYALRNIITIGLQNRDIEIPGNGYVSDKLLETEKIEEYLTDHSEVLSKKIRGSFKPRFIPGTDNYSKWMKRFCDYAEYNGHLKMYEAQKAVSQACANMLSDKKSTFIIGECSSGKYLPS